jgi:hypothetical protein
MAGRWLGEREAAIDRRREAYAAYQRRGDARSAGGLATYLAGEHRIDGQDAAASGSLSRVVMWARCRATARPVSGTSPIRAPPFGFGPRVDG